MIKAAAGLVALSLVALTTTSAAASERRDVYVSDNGADRVSGFRTDGSGALLTERTTVTSNDAEGMVFSADGRFLYVSDTGGQSVNAYSVAADGTLAPVLGPGGLAGGGFPYAITVTPDGKFLYAAFGGPNSFVRRYAIRADGGLTGSPQSTVIGGAAGIRGIVASPDSRSIYVVDENLDQLRAYSIAADGSLTEKPGSPIATGDSPTVAQITPDGRRIYVGNYTSDDISGYSIAASGTLTAIDGSPFPGVDGPYGGMAISPDGRRLYATGANSGQVVSYAIAGDGKLATIGTPVAAGTFATGLAITPDGKRVYSSARSSRQAYSFTVQSDGSLAANGSPLALDNPGASDFQSVAIRPNQPPTARLTTRTVGGRVTLNASTSTDSDGTVSAYTWRFGDGTSATTTAPTVTHTYASGTYLPKVTLTDDEGCSTTFVSTGLSALCNGSAVATAGAQVRAGVDRVTVKARKTQKQKRKLAVVVRAGAGEAVSIAVTGTAKVKGLRGRITLKRASATVRGGTATLRLVATNRAKGKAAVGRKGTARLIVILTDADGYTVRRTLTVRLR
ncbi:beta-propeller fold lactonase family protein [Nocardioides lijunqiniae]|uniref:beta-propeller fold lactonase family protein n=1 Tax=Nocardioides lijunqiniae TaxID=2760832 RepID=UPI0018775D4C